MPTIDLSGLSRLTPEEATVRLNELASRVYEACDPGSDHPSFAVSAAALVFAQLCKVNGIPLEKAKDVLGESWSLTVKRG